ncbi:hypothetical protein LVB87_06250 [Lysobacter sp. KIS68-7]|uniref:hypothetical protein n=1 Tax=Lysobacter sp. KIS68-7 TaxID=2904252 RepID=UPI001E54E2A5|nr:hypothetical protein [Lysobacter sp. KIS68-7]UHQ20741.1 hypothetical protein LVB87_06250 [Lysobacter sp. KIS68-7]
MTGPTLHLPRVALALFAALLPFAAIASTVQPRNVVHLLEDAQDIVVGSVTQVSDGIDPNGVPYTEVTLGVGETLRGDATHTLVFRQFGLLAPRVLPDGRTLYAVRPQGWPQFAAGERVLLFLTPPARQTGLRTTVGLLQGKLTMTGDRLQSSAGEGALFDAVDTRSAPLTTNERAIVDAPTASYDADAFLAFLRRAIAQRWVETGSVRHAP